MLWLCLRLPRLPLECLPPSSDEAALAVVEGERVIMTSAEAQRCGVTTGQSSQTARSLCSHLHCVERDPAREQTQLQRIALWAYRFSGTVYLVSPNAVVMELASSLRLFRNLARLYRRLIRAFRQRQLTVYSAVAATPLAAEWLSLSNPPIATLVNAQGELQQQAVSRALAALPLTLLPFSANTQEMLHNLGLNTLGQLQALPLDSLNQRLGPSLGRDLQRLQGQRPDPRSPFAPAPTFSAQRQFEGGLSSTEQLRFPAAALLDELKLYLQCRQCLNRDLHWHFEFLDGGRDTVSLQLSHRHFNRADALMLTMLRFDSLVLPSAVETLSLSCEDFLPLQAPPRGLFDSAATRQQDRLPALLDKLQLRLGKEAITQYRDVDAQLPELGWQAIPPCRQALLQTPPPQASSPASAQRHAPLHRPAWLLDPPQAIYRHGQQLYWRGSLQLLQGPERLDSHWWQQRQARDYYIARHQDGRLCWLYRDGVSRAWYLHGFFA